MILKEITIPSIEEYAEYQNIIPNADWWWLRSPGRLQNCAVGVCPDGTLDEDGFDVCFSEISVRPVLKFSLEPADALFWQKREILIGSKMQYGKCDWTILSVKDNELYMICSEYIGERCFDSKSNDWETSELKTWLEAEGLKCITT